MMDLKTCSEFLKCPNCGITHGKLFGFDVIIDENVRSDEIQFRVNDRVVGKIVLDKE